MTADMRVVRLGAHVAQRILGKIIDRTIVMAQPLEEPRGSQESSGEYDLHRISREVVVSSLHGIHRCTPLSTEQ